MSKLLGILGGLKFYLLVGGVALAAGFAGGVKWQDGVVANLKLKHAEQESATLRSSLDRAYRTGEITAQLGLKAAERQVAIQTRTIERIREVPNRVSPQADARCTVPVGAVRVHNEAAADAAPGAVPFAPGQPDDAAAGVALSRLLSVTAANYGTCHQVRQQLIDLQSWVRAQQAAASSP